jgi:hypothetical protein
LTPDDQQRLANEATRELAGIVEFSAMKISKQARPRR